MASKNISLSQSLCSLYGSIPSNAIYFNSKTINNNETYIDKYIVISGDLIINCPVAIFTRCTFNISSGSEIIINSNKNLRSNGCLYFACDNPWEGIRVESNGFFLCQNNSTYPSIIENAYNAIVLNDKAKLTLANTQLRRNDRCMYIAGKPVILRFDNNTFSGEYFNPIIYNFNVGIELLWYDNPQYKIRSTFDIQNIATGINKFESLKTGIRGQASNIKIQNCQFSNCDIGISNGACYGQINYIKGFGKESDTVTFTNNAVYNIIISGYSLDTIVNCKLLVDNRYNRSHRIPKVRIGENLIGSIYIANNSFITDLYISHYNNTSTEEINLDIYKCQGPTLITNNSFQSINHSGDVAHATYQLQIGFGNFQTPSVISNNVFKFSNIYCAINSFGEIDEMNSTNGEINDCLVCLPSRSLLVALCTRVDILNNTFEKENCQATSTEINGCNRITVEGNIYNELNRIRHCDNVGLRIVGSYITVCSNLFNDNFIGIDALFMSGGTEISANTFKDNFTGIHYFGTALIYSQRHRGNIWNGDFESGYKLIHDVNNDPVYAKLPEFNSFWIDHNNYNSSNNYWPETWTPNEFVFDDQNSLRSCLYPKTPDDLDLFYSIPYGPRWESYYQIVKFLEEGGEYENNKYDEIYDSLYLSTLYKLMLIEVQFKNYQNVLTNFSDSLLILDTLISTISNQIEEKKTLLVEDSVTTALIIDTLYQAIDSLGLLKENIYTDLTTSRNAYLDSLILENDSIETITQIEENRQFLHFVSMKYLRYDTLSSEDSTYLHELSLNCSKDDGNNPVIARSILRSYYSLNLPDVDECQENEELKSVKNISEHEKIDAIHIMNSIDSRLTTEYELFDLLGRRINYKNRNLRGMFILHYKDVNGQFKSTKIWLP